MYNFKFDFNNPVIMGIVNVTPDSFSGDGLLQSSHFIEAALDQAQRFIHAGADIIDIGGESTRPGATAVSLEDEIKRVIPVVEAIHLHFPNTKISVDTTKAAVAQKALEAGASIINDVSGLMMDPSMVDVIIARDASIIIMHSHQNPNIEQTDLGGRYLTDNNTDIVELVKKDLERLSILAIGRGVKPHNIILDPGIGFGKSTQQNLMLINKLNDLKSLGFPVLLGASRKSFIGYTTHSSTDCRLGGSIAANIIGMIRGADIFRVHDVAETVQALRLLAAIKEMDAATKAA